MGDQPVVRPLPTHRINGNIDIHAFEWIPVNSSDRVATLIGELLFTFFIFGATAPILALAYLHETLRFTSVY
jgi:hypothetical protein